MKHFFNAKGPEVNDTWEKPKKNSFTGTGSFLKNFNGRPGDESQATDVSFVGNLFQPPTKNAISPPLMPGRGAKATMTTRNTSLPGVSFW